MSSFKDLRIVDNFYQTSSYIPMPTVMISSLAEDGSTSVGSYSLCFPYYIAGKDYYSLILEARIPPTPPSICLQGAVRWPSTICRRAETITRRSSHRAGPAIRLQKR